MTRSRLGIGLAAVARPAYINAGRERDLGERRGVDDLQSRTWDVLDAAVGAGIAYVDVARSYGRAEQFLAAWLHARPGVRVEIGSKWGYRYVGGWAFDAAVHEVKDHSLAAFEQQRDETLALLGDRLDVYHVHSATLETGVLDDARLHAAMAALRDSGVAVGISTSGPGQAAAIRRALEVAVDGVPLFTSFQATWNVLEPSVAPALAEAAAAGARVLVKEPLANGRLAPGSTDPAPGARRVQQLAARLEVPADVLALAAALIQPWATYVLSGAVTTDQVVSNAAAAGLDLPPEIADQLAGLAEDPHGYWAARSGRPWS
jgi:aryl-alcohol dehydrogenase-like predicted oxidoreductase